MPYGYQHYGGGLMPLMDLENKGQLGQWAGYFLSPDRRQDLAQNKSDWWDQSTGDWIPGTPWYIRNNWEGSLIDPSLGGIEGADLDNIQFGARQQELGAAEFFRNFLGMMQQGQPAAPAAAAPPASTQGMNGAGYGIRPNIPQATQPSLNVQSPLAPYFNQITPEQFFAQAMQQMAAQQYARPFDINNPPYAQAQSFEQGGTVSPNPRLQELLNMIGQERQAGEVPIMAHQGEVVMNREAVNQIGEQNLNALNQVAQMPRYENGGTVNVQDPNGDWMVLSEGGVHKYFYIPNESAAAMRAAGLQYAPAPPTTGDIAFDMSVGPPITDLATLHERERQFSQDYINSPVVPMNNGDPADLAGTPFAIPEGLIEEDKPGLGQRMTDAVNNFLGLPNDNGPITGSYVGGRIATPEERAQANIDPETQRIADVAQRLEDERSLIAASGNRESLARTRTPEARFQDAVGGNPEAVLPGATAVRDAQLPEYLWKQSPTAMNLGIEGQDWIIGDMRAPPPGWVPLEGAPSWATNTVWVPGEASPPLPSEQASSDPPTEHIQNVVGPTIDLTVEETLPELRPNTVTLPFREVTPQPPAQQEEQVLPQPTGLVRPDTEYRQKHQSLGLDMNYMQNADPNDVMQYLYEVASRRENPQMTRRQRMQGATDPDMPYTERLFSQMMQLYSQGELTPEAIREAGLRNDLMEQQVRSAETEANVAEATEEAQVGYIEARTALTAAQTADLEWQTDFRERTEEQQIETLNLQLDMLRTDSDLYRDFKDMDLSLMDAQRRLYLAQAIGHENDGTMITTFIQQASPTDIANMLRQGHEVFQDYTRISQSAAENAREALAQSGLSAQEKALFTRQLMTATAQEQWFSNPSAIDSDTIENYFNLVDTRPVRKYLEAVEAGDREEIEKWAERAYADFTEATGVDAERFESIRESTRAMIQTRDMVANVVGTYSMYGGANPAGMVTGGQPTGAQIPGGDTSAALMQLYEIAPWMFEQPGQ